MEVRNREALINDLAHSIAISNGIAFLVGARQVDYHDFSLIVSEQSVKTGQIPEKIGQILHNLMIFKLPYEKLMDCLRPSMTSPLFQEGLRMVADFVARILRFQPLTSLIAIYKTIIEVYCSLLRQYDANLYFNGDVYTQDWGIQDRLLTGTLTTFIERKFGFAAPQGQLSLSYYDGKNMSFRQDASEPWQMPSYASTPKYTPMEHVYNQDISGSRVLHNRPRSGNHLRSSPGVRFATDENSSSNLSVSHLGLQKGALRSGSAQKYTLYTAQSSPRSRSSAPYVPPNLKFQYPATGSVASAPLGRSCDGGDDDKQMSQDSAIDTAQSWLDKCTAELVLEKNEGQKQLLYDHLILVIEDTLKKLKAFKLDVRSDSRSDIDSLLASTDRRAHASMPSTVLQDENNRLKIQIQALEVTTAAITKKCKEKEDECNELASQYNSMRELNETLRREKQDTEEQNRTVELKQGEAEEDIARQKRTIMELESRLEAYKDNLVNYEEQISDMSIKLRKSENEMSAFEELKATMERTISNYKSENEALVEALVCKKEEVNTLQKELSMHQTSMLKSSSCVAGTKAERPLSVSFAPELEPEPEPEPGQDQDRVAHVDSAYKTSISESRLDRLTAENNQLRYELQMAQATLSEMRLSAGPVLDALQASHTIDTVSGNGLNLSFVQLSRENKELQEELARTKGELQKRILDSERLERQLQIATTSLEHSSAQATSLQKQLQQMMLADTSKRGHGTAFSEEPTEFTTLSTDELARENSQLKVKIPSPERAYSEADTENGTMGEKLSKQTAQIEDLIGQVSKLTTENLDLTQKLEVMSLTATKLQAEMSSLRENQIRQAQKSSSELADAEEKMKTAKSIEKKLSAMEASSITEKTLLQQQLGDITAAHVEALSIIEKLKGENKALRQDMNILAETTRHGTGQIEKLLQENERLRKELESLQDIQYISQKTIQSFKDEVATLCRKESDSKTFVATLERRLDEAQSENDELRKQITRSDDSMRRLFTESNTLATRVQKQQETIVHLEGELTRARAKTPPGRTTWQDGK